MPFRGHCKVLIICLFSTQKCLFTVLWVTVIQSIPSTSRSLFDVEPISMSSADPQQMDIDDTEPNGTKHDPDATASDVTMDSAPPSKLQSASKDIDRSPSSSTTESSTASPKESPSPSTESASNSDSKSKSIASLSTADNVEVDPSASSSLSNGTVGDKLDSDRDTEMSNDNESELKCAERTAGIERKDDLEVEANVDTKTDFSSNTMSSKRLQIRLIQKVGVGDDGNLLPGFEEVSDDFEIPAFQSESDFAIFTKQISSEIPLQRVWTHTLSLSPSRSLSVTAKMRIFHIFELKVIWRLKIDQNRESQPFAIWPFGFWSDSRSALSV